MAKPLSAYTARRAATTVLICPRIMFGSGRRRPALLREIVRLNGRLVGASGAVEAASDVLRPARGLRNAGILVLPRVLPPCALPVEALTQDCDGPETATP